MTTFQSVGDEEIAALIEQATRQVVLITPGVFGRVVEALERHLLASESTVDVTVILDTDEDVCRIGYGDVDALQRLHQAALKHGEFVRSQPGLRIGVLIADDQTLVWSPTARSIEAAQGERDASAGQMNAVRIGVKPLEQLVAAVAAPGTNCLTSDAELGRKTVSEQDVQSTVDALKANPPIPVDLARVSRVFSTKLQFVELRVKGASVSKKELRIDSSLLNADAGDELRSFLDSRLKAFGEVRDIEVEVPVFIAGEKVFHSDQKEVTQAITEQHLDLERRSLERSYFHAVPGFGMLMEKARRERFQSDLDAFKARLVTHAEGVRTALEAQANRIVGEAAQLIEERLARAQTPTTKRTFNREAFEEHLREAIGKTLSQSPEVSVVFKDVTYEQTKSEEFRQKVSRALPSVVTRRLGPWFEHFDAAHKR